MDSCGGGNHGLSCPPSFCCPCCGEAYAERCHCHKRACPTCGTMVFFTGDQPQPHVCSRPFDPALHMAQGIARLAQEIFEAGRAAGQKETARGGSAQTE